jgi:hypothetical protein
MDVFAGKIGQMSGALRHYHPGILISRSGTKELSAFSEKSDSLRSSGFWVLTEATLS